MSARMLRLGTRGSRLALVQAERAARALEAAGIGLTLEIIVVRTRGDDISHRKPHAGWEATDGQFTADLERRLVAGEIDVAVHSLKDLPTDSDADVTTAAILERDDPRDCLLTARGETWDDLPFGARVGTGSARRAAQLAAMRPDFVARPIRGNVETRIARMGAGEYDAVMLAAAGLDRLGLPLPDAARLSLDLVLPAPGQGAIAIQCRRDHPSAAAVAAADHAATRAAVRAERALLRAIGGGCLAPLGAAAELRDDGQLRLRAVFEHRDGTLQRADVAGPADDWRALVAHAAEALGADAGAVLPQEAGVR